MDVEQYSPEMAVRLGRFSGSGPGLWLRLQVEYDLGYVERRLHDEVELIPRHVAV